MLIDDHFCMMEIVGYPGSLIICSGSFLSFVIQSLLYVIGNLLKSLILFLLQLCLVGLKRSLLFLLLLLLMQMLVLFYILITFCLIFSSFGRQLPIFVLDRFVQLGSFDC